MKNFTIKALALAAASLCGSVALAGTATSTLATYAVEAVTATTVITLPAVNYQLGVSRTNVQDFTIVIKPQAGSTFDGTVCNAAKPAPTVGANANTVSLKRASSAECAYEVDVTNVGGSDTNLVLTFTGLKLTAHSLATGGTEKLSVGLWDQGETARIDNSNDILVTVANSGQAVTILAGTDTGTTADVDHAAGPLYGFVAANNDTTNVATASFVVSNNPNSYKIADGVTAFDVANVNHAAKVTFTVSGDFDGAVLTNGAVTGVTVVDPVATAPAVTMTGTTAAGFQLPAAKFAAATVNQIVSVSFASGLTKSLGTARSFGVSAVVDNVVGADTTITNNNFWTWDANAIELRTAFFNNDSSPGNFTRFFFQNVGASAGYQAVCQVDDAAKTVTYGAAKNGTLRSGQTTITASDICTFSAGQRGAITFTINAPAKNVKGVYQQAVNGVSTAYIPLERPYALKTY